LFDPDFVHRHRLSPNAFTRRRQLPFSHLVTVLLNLRKGSARQELRQFFATLHEEPLAEAPTRKALWKARQQLSPLAFADLNREAVASFRSGMRSSLYHGFRLLAVDGTTLRLPLSEAVERAFGEAAEGPPLGRVSVLYDIGQDLVVDAQLAALCVSERELAIDHLAHAVPGDLVIYDRGYPAFWLMALHRDQGVDFCMRLCRSSFAVFEPFWQSDEPSAVVTLPPSSQQKRHCRDQRVSDEALRVRLVRVRLKGGQTEVLVTSVIEETRLPAKAFKALYHKRWSVEENIKRQKRWAEIENFSGRSVLVVRQDFHAKILALNLTAMARQVADVAAKRHFQHRRYTQQVCWTDALSTMKNTLVRLLLHEEATLNDLWRRLIETLATEVDAVRPDRSYPRENPGRLKPGFHHSYKRAS